MSNTSNGYNICQCMNRSLIFLPIYIRIFNRPILTRLEEAARHNRNPDQVPSWSYPHRAVRLSCAAWASVCAIQRSLAPAGACTVSTTPLSACTASASPLQNAKCSSTKRNTVISWRLNNTLRKTLCHKVRQTQCHKAFKITYAIESESARCGY